MKTLLTIFILSFSTVVVLGFLFFSLESNERRDKDSPEDVHKAHITEFENLTKTTAPKDLEILYFLKYGFMDVLHIFVARSSNTPEWERQITKLWGNTFKATKLDKQPGYNFIDCKRLKYPNLDMQISKYVNDKNQYALNKICNILNKQEDIYHNHPNKNPYGHSYQNAYIAGDLIIMTLEGH